MTGVPGPRGPEAPALDVLGVDVFLRLGDDGEEMHVGAAYGTDWHDLQLALAALFRAVAGCIEHRAEGST